MSRSFNFSVLAGEIKTTVVTDELALEESLRSLLSKTYGKTDLLMERQTCQKKITGKLHGRARRGNVGRDLERVVALDMEESFCSASYGTVKERVVARRGNVGRDLERVVALDIEKSFCSASYGMVKERVVVLILGVDNDCLIIHLTHFEKVPTSLSKFLDLSDITFVGVSIKSNLADLQRDYGIQCRNGVDLGVFAAAVRASPGISAYPLPYLFKCIVPLISNDTYSTNTFSNNAFCKPADVAFSEWGTSMLSEKQIEHASLVVHMTFKIVEQLWPAYA
ncbi:hypothetical protein I3760_04G029100 [Carya illinoinensis]|nr:hypothetical protein I3760_04G029100 [Carya illinoinensis]